MWVLEALKQMLSWAHLLVLLGGLAVCVVHWRRSRWLAAILAAFALELVDSVFYQLAGLALGQRWIEIDGLRWAYLLAALLGLVGKLLLVVGLAGLLAGLRPGSERAAGAR